MPSTKVYLLLCFLCTTPFKVLEGQVISDENPTDYPYLVKLLLTRSAPWITIPGLVVSSQIVLTSSLASYAMYTDVTVVDQLGVARPAAKSVNIVLDAFTYYKVCRKFQGVENYYSLNESSFNDLSASVPDAQLVFYNTSSPIPRNVTVSVMSEDECLATFSTAPVDVSEVICMTGQTAPGFCAPFVDDAGSYVLYPVIAIGGQVHGFTSLVGCSGSFLTGERWVFTRIAHFRENLTMALSQVVNY
ncbi:uncharacterized protein LOC135943465 [Cloeon dipterum]|uniref:uncharacterized protein LOC135943465 n=1 Tax=Cloeon dipterum TaxID=197152 RepID=UPI003220097C